ncbi:DUF5110 domain-containing protein [Rheinheimera sp. UJ51]|uniref:glycoside hydrolase family 31 protein n=1 Tax=unclassified Rheinheimera TaxID=115860 RepID=UPI001E315DF5|nr:MULTISPECIES: TIM-barrel domain-containing protein [unclassified Rheinheimera]MCC5450605.1 DUF5110 domain-containing protein [Rheinheimera sp. UJ51]MCF4008737.1 DUF5110 domain-containing protein [Rheinheimera sp. UJ63]
MQRYFQWLVCSALLFASLLLGAAEHYQSHRVNDNQLILTTDRGQVSVRFQHEAAVEVWYQPEGRQQLPSLILADKTSAVALTLQQQPEQLILQSARLRVEIQKSPLALRFYQGERLLTEDIAGLLQPDATKIAFKFRLTPEEMLFGGGQRVLGMDRRGHKLPLYNKAHYGYSTESNQMYFSLAGVMSSKNYMLLFDNGASGELDLGHSQADTLAFQAEGGRSAYIVVAGQNTPELIANYTAASGQAPLPARWTLGNYASRFGYRTEAEARAVVQKFRDLNLPLDAIVIDLYWFGKDIQGHMGNLAWDKQAFPTPEQMLADFAADGIKTILVTEPFILTSSKRWQQAVDAGAIALGPDGKPKTFDFYFGNTGLIDVFKPEASSWFWGIYRDLLAQGVGGIWGDLGEPEVHPADTLHQLPGIGSVTANEVHNAYGQRWAELVYQGYRQDFPEQRPFIMMRAGNLGSQRYGMVPWTGDVDRSWGGLKPQVELALQMGLFGFGYIHSDLGGFAGGEQFDAELYIRWLQYGVFQPVYRPHAQEHIAPEPVFHSDEVIDTLRPWLNLRYQLLPYNYTLAYQHSQTGIPLMRPLFFLDETNPSLRTETNSYLWGDAFLVAPVTEPGVTQWPVNVPTGVWFDFFNGERIIGGEVVKRPVSLETIPVLVKAGSFIPMTAPIQRTADYSSQALTLHYFADASVSSAQGQLFEDDGVTPDSLAKGQYELLNFNAQHSNEQLLFSLQRQGGDYQGKPAQRELTLVVHNQRGKPDKIYVDGQYIPLVAQPQRFAKSQQLAWYDKAAKKVYIKLTWQAELSQIVIK